VATDQEHVNDLRALTRRGYWVVTPLGAVLLLIVVLAFMVFRPFLLNFTVAASVALLLSPLQRQLRAWLRDRRNLAASLLVLLVVVLILLPVLSYGALIGEQAVVFFEWVRPRLRPAALQTLWREILAHFPWLASFLAQDERALAELASGTLSSVASAANGLVQASLARLTTIVFDLVLFLMLLFFLLRDGPALRRELGRISPFSGDQEVEIFGHLEKTIKGVLQSMVLVPLAQGLAATLGFVYFGVPAPLLWGVTAVLAALIPLVGSPLAWVPAVIYLFFAGTTFQWVGMLIYGFVIVSGIDNVVKPLILRGTASIHPLLGFLSILGGMLSFGPSGFLVGPVVLSLILSAIRIYGADVLGRQMLPPPRPTKAPEVQTRLAG